MARKKSAKLTTEPTYLRRRSLAARYDVSEATIDRWRKERIVPSLKVAGGATLYSIAKCDAALGLFEAVAIAAPKLAVIVPPATVAVASTAINLNVERE